MDRKSEARRAGIQPSNAFPETAAASAAGLTEYCVTAANRNEEGARSRMVNTNSVSWRNWDPHGGRTFRRVDAFPPNSPPSPDSLPRYYPRSIVSAVFAHASVGVIALKNTWEDWFMAWATAQATRKLPVT
jgi:hypothetical protein